MIAVPPGTAYRQRRASVRLGHVGPPVATASNREHHSDHWVEPHTLDAYPVRYEAYRRIREAQDRRRPGHRALGPDVDHYVWQRWGRTRSPDVEIILVLRAGTPTRIRRLVAEILRAIRRGRPASEAIREVSRRFGLRPARTRACLATCVGFALLPRGDDLSRLTERPWMS